MEFPIQLVSMKPSVAKLGFHPGVGVGIVPKGTKVDKVYQAVKRAKMASGMSKEMAEKHAAMIAQAKTGKSLATGRKPKKKR